MLMDFDLWSSLSCTIFSAIFYQNTFVNIDFILVSSYSIYDMFYQDLFIFIYFRYLISSCGTQNKLYRNALRIFISSLETSLILTYFLERWLLILEQTFLLCFMHDVNSFTILDYPTGESISVVVLAGGSRYKFFHSTSFS